MGLFKTIGFIGVGIMGKSMVRNLMKNGYEVHIYARHPDKVRDIVAEGAVLHSSIVEAVKDRDAVFTSVGGPDDVEEIYFGEGGILKSATKGTFLIDTTTSSPELAVRLYESGRKSGFHVLDVPVTGGDVGARTATLSMLAGGDREDYEKALELLSCLGSNINYEGMAGCGQHTKAVNQIMVAASLAGMCEGFAYAKVHGLCLKTVLKSVASGAAGSRSLDLYADRLIAGDMQPGGALKFLVKDLKIAREGLTGSGIRLKAMEQILEEYQQMVDEGLGDLGTQALYEFCLRKRQ
ncbi:MAG: NAD(P)-dependent oxidoreductase [Succinivibrio sp.]|nr:NAD(P)-dependent oxidoreductase [Succinivibrio sp.]